MIRAKNEINQFGCNCGIYAISLEHALTCPMKSSFLLSCPIERVKENFTRFGYGESVTPPNLEAIKESGNKMAEMMQCDCGHWFPRWEYYRCPSCWKGH
ncbi:MAG: hypothetical protein U9O65_08025 [Thermotogota bacterium]|nr:hypothetical protein [Thermotogota bacterium]